MLFEEALHLMRNGLRVARTGWNGNWVAIGSLQPVEIEADKFWNRHSRAHAIKCGGKGTVAPYFLSRGTRGHIQMGWTPTQEDLLASDWVELQDLNINEH